MGPEILLPNNNLLVYNKMFSTIILKNAEELEKWERAVAEHAAQLLSEDLLGIKNDNSPDPSR